MIPRLALIGVGKFGINHLRTLQKLDDKKIIKFVGFVEINSKIRNKIKNDFLIRSSDSIDDFVNDVDAFDIVTPPKTHYDLVKTLLNKNKDIFVEKPLALTWKESVELERMAQKKKLNLQVGHIFRHHPQIKFLKNFLKIPSNSPYYIKTRFLQRSMQKHETGSIFVFLHGFDIIDNIIGKNPSKIFSIENIHNSENKFEINSSVNIFYPKLNVEVNVGWIPSGKFRDIEIFTKNRRIICDLLTNEIKIFKNNKLEKKSVILMKDEPLYTELHFFSNNVKNRTFVDNNIGSRIVKICELATKSGKTKKLINFNSSK